MDKLASKERRMLTDGYSFLSLAPFGLKALDSFRFEDNTFSVTFHEDGLENVEKWPEAIAEMVRVTKPGGALIIAAPNHNRLLKREKKGGAGQNGHHSVRPKELVRIFEKLGLLETGVSGFDLPVEIRHLHKLSNLRAFFAWLVAKPLNVLTGGLFSEKFGSKIYVKGIKPQMETNRALEQSGEALAQTGVRNDGLLKKAEGDLKDQAVQGVMWSGFSQITTELFRFIFMAILARILLPKDFGTLGMAFIFTGLISMVNELGLAAAIIQKKDITDKHLSTAFWVCGVVGILSWLISIIAAPFIASFFKREILENIVILISSGFIISSLGVVHKTILNKNLDFKRISVTEVLSALVYGVSAITLSVLGFGVWSLVTGYLASTAVEVLLLWTLAKWRPKLTFNITSFKELFGFGINVWFFNFINYGRENVDYFLIGRYLGPTPLGFYTLAYSLANAPRRKLSTIITRVTFPTFSKIQDENERLSKIYLKTTSYLSLITFPFLAGLMAVAPEFIRIIYGDKWIPMILALQLLCIAGMLYSIGTTVGTIYLAKGRPDLQLKVGTAFFMFLTIFVLIGIRFGINGVAAAVMSYTLVSLLVSQYFANSLIGLKMREYLLSLLPATFSSMAMVMMLLGLRFINNYFINLSNLFLIMTLITAGGLVYLVILKIFNFREFNELTEIIKKQLSPLKNQVAVYIKNKFVKKRVSESCDALSGRPRTIKRLSQN